MTAAGAQRASPQAADLTTVRYCRTLLQVEIRNVKHRGLKRLLEDDDGRGIRRDLIPRVRNILSALVSASDMRGVAGPPGWRVHRLTGDRGGTWSVSVSGNWRITFDIESGEIRNLNLEDYH